MRIPIRTAYIALALGGAFGLSASGASAQDAQNPQPLAPATYGGIGVAVGSGKLIKLPHPVANIFAADPDIIEVRPASPDTMFVFGRKQGETTIVATDGNGNTIAQYSVTVDPSPYASDRLQSQAQASAPGNGVTAESEAGGMIVRGTVDSADQADNVLNQAKLISPSGTVINDLEVREPIQVELKVRIASMSRNVTRELGIDWGSVTSSGFNIGKFLLSGSTGS